MIKLLKNVVAFIFIAGVSSAIGQQLSGGGGGGGSGCSQNCTITETAGNSALTLTGATQTASNPVLNITQTQNNGAVPFTGIKANFTVTASNNAGFFLDLQRGGSSLFSVSEFGAVVSNSTGRFGSGSALIGNNAPNSALTVTSTNTMGFAPSTNLAVQPDVVWSRAAAATFQFGIADAAAPVAQTTQVQSVVAGTTDTAGVDWSIKASKGTGTGAGGNFIIATAPAGTTGTSQNAHVNALIVDSKSHVRVGATTAPALTSCGTSPTITGTDLAGVVTMGTTATGCVVTFNKAYAATPFCTVTWQATPLASQSYVVSTSAITLTQTSASNNLVNYHCFAQTAG